MDPNIKVKTPLDMVFSKRKKIGKYNKIKIKEKEKLEEIFLKNPYPSNKLLEDFIKENPINSLQKLRNWFKSRRKKEFNTSKNSTFIYKKHHCFSKQESKILENSFRKKSDLTNGMINSLQKKLNCKQIYIKRWFHYRKTKLIKLKNGKNIKTNSQNIDQIYRNILNNEEKKINSDLNKNEIKKEFSKLSNENQSNSDLFEKVKKEYLPLSDPNYNFENLEQINEFNNYSPLNLLNNFINYYEFIEKYRQNLVMSLWFTNMSQQNQFN